MFGTAARSAAYPASTRAFHAATAGAWLGGGAQVAQAALEKDMVDTTFLCHTSAMLGGGIPSGPIRALLPKVAKHTVVMDLTSTIEVFHHRLGS